MVSAQHLFRMTWLPVLVASLCCLAPVILVLFGLSTVAFAASLADLFYGEYKWLFRATGLILLTFSVVLYLRRQRGICTFDQARQRRNEVINVVALALTAGVIGYIVWLYGVVELIGWLLGIWGL